MKVLAISASPRKGGNSDVLCDQFLKGAAEAGNEVKKISLGQVNISPCVACYGCSKSHQCVKKDDMAQILQELIEADVIVLATPVYFYSTATIQRLEERVADYRTQTELAASTDVTEE